MRQYILLSWNHGQTVHDTNAHFSLLMVIVNQFARILLLLYHNLYSAFIK